MKSSSITFRTAFIDILFTSYISITIKFNFRNRTDIQFYEKQNILFAKSVREFHQNNKINETPHENIKKIPDMDWQTIENK